MRSIICLYQGVIFHSVGICLFVAVCVFVEGFAGKFAFVREKGG